MEKMHYLTPPAEWMEGLPIGNGRLAAMVWGDETDRLTLNHEWLWTGVNRYREVPDAAECLPFLRKLIRREDYFRATAMANALWGGTGGISGLPNRVDPYQPAGELTFTPDHDAFAGRELDIRTGVTRVFRQSGLTAEFFADCKGSCIAACWQSPAPFSGTFSLSREAEEGTAVTVTAKAGELALDGAIRGGISFAVRVSLETDGQMLPQGQSLRVENASYVRVTVNMATDLRDIQKELAEHAFPLSDYERVKDAHQAKFQELMGRIDFKLEGDESLEELPTDERIRRVKEGAVDNGISRLYFDFNRYLLTASSVCGELPANLQGKWNDSLTPPWDCDYHFDINLEMNYWMAEPRQSPMH